MGICGVKTLSAKSISLSRLQFHPKGSNVKVAGAWILFNTKAHLPLCWAGGTHCQHYTSGSLKQATLIKANQLLFAEYVDD